jgi:hypothetical protein
MALERPLHQVHDRAIIERAPPNVRGLEGFQKTDAGREAEGFANQRNDCTVRAIVCACDVKYKEAFYLLTAMGRKSHKRYPFEVLGDKFFDGFAASGTYRKFRETHMIGTFIVKVKGHVFALVDGKTLDTGATKAGKHVLRAWTVTEEHKQKLHDFFLGCQEEVNSLPAPCKTENEKKALEIVKTVERRGVTWTMTKWEKEDV